ncbi:MAG TPA: glycosyltransferase [Pyrinomonadaceae bacterium]|jgi:glycosyltransferase involved in cell wall biosynthesis|nr:glycosyltransferase [Pyrinomonadaceae bacterium]
MAAVKDYVMATAARDVRASEPVIAVLIPCYNEELTVAQVVGEFRAQLPEADIYVFDNNSSDGTVERAREAGAQVFFERRQGKGYVVQSMFRQVDADIYIMVDGDGTYPPAEVQRLIEPVLADEADMVVGSRLHDESSSQFKSLNRMGNKMFLSVLNSVFKVKITDMLSGYRVFNRRFVKGVPLFGGGFETETELTIKALERGYRVVEVPVDLTTRPEGSFSKIRIVHDGLRILNTILALFRDYKPLTFFGAVGLALVALSLIPGLIVVFEFFKTGLVLRLPSAVLAVGLALAGMLSMTIGLVLHTIVRRSQEFDHQLRTMLDELRTQINRDRSGNNRGEERK